MRRSGPLERKKPLRSTPSTDAKSEGGADRKGLTRSKGLAAGKGLNPGKGLNSGKGLAAGTLGRGKGFASKSVTANALGSGKSLTRKSPSTPPSTLPRAQPRKPRKPMSRKPPVMTPEERNCRAIVAARSGGFCERCGNPGQLEKAHRTARSQLGAWRASNVMDLCRKCHHDDNHAHPAQAYEGGWHLRSGFDPLTSKVLLWKGTRYDWALLDDDGNWHWLEDR